MSVASSSSRINDFVIKIATVNGTGSASANTRTTPSHSTFVRTRPSPFGPAKPSGFQGIPAPAPGLTSISRCARRPPTGPSIRCSGD